MATSVNVTSGYEGVLAGEILTQALKKASTFNENAISVLPNVIGSGFLPRLDYTAVLQDGTGCGFDDEGTISYVDKEVALKKYKLDHEICKEDFAQTFQAVSSGLYSATAEIPATIEDAILLSIVENLGALIDNQIWNGTGVTASFNGLIAQFEADGDVIDVDAATVTSANVQAELAKIYDAIPAEIEDDAELVWVVSRNIAKAYKQSQIGNYLVGTPVGDKELDYLGIKLSVIDGLPANTSAVYRRKNVAFLTGLESDYNNVRIVDRDATELDGNVRTQVKFTAGVGFSRGSEIVLYNPA